MDNSIRLSLSFGVFILVASATAADQREGTDDHHGDNAVRFTIVKRVYPRAERNTLWFAVHCLQPNVRVHATCDLRQNYQGVGRFPLRQLEVETGLNAIRFTVGCLANAIVDDSLIHVSIHDNATGKSIAGTRIRLKDAKVGEPDQPKHRTGAPSARQGTHKLPGSMILGIGRLQKGALSTEMVAQVGGMSTLES